MVNEVDNKVSNSPTASYGGVTGDKDAYGNVNLNAGVTTTPKTTADHLNTIKGFSSLTDIQNYINAHIINPLKQEKPPNLSGIDRILTELITTSGTIDKKLAAILYHTIDNNLGYKLDIQNQQVAGQRKIVLNGSGRNIDDATYGEIATAGQDIASYHNTYFSAKGGTPATTPPATTPPATPSTTTPSTTTPSTTTPSTTTTTDTEDTPEDTKEPSVDIATEFFKAYPEDTDFSKFNKIRIIDTKTGKEIKPDKYDANDPKETAELEKLMARSITIHTKGNGDAVTDSNNMQKIADALSNYIMKPFETEISEETLEDIIDNFSLEAQSEIFNLVQKKIISGGTPSQIMNFRKYKHDTGDNGLDGIIYEIYEYNYSGGNEGNPELFLMDIFASDQSYKLQPTNINTISIELAKSVTEYFNLKDSDDEEDIREKNSHLNFISGVIQKLSATNTDAIGKENIAKLLQAVNDKAGNSPDIKDFLTDMALKAGVDTFKGVNIQTGQSLMSNFGELTFTDENGMPTTFSSKDADGGFGTVKTHLKALLLGTHESIIKNEDPSDPQGNLEAKAITAAQAADAIAMLSDAQQEVIIEDLTPDEAIDLEALASALPAPNENLNKLINKVKFQDIITDVKSATTTTEKADIFADGIMEFTDKLSPKEMTNFVTSIVGSSQAFLGLKSSTLGEFKSLLTQKLKDDAVTDGEITTILENLENSLNLNKVKFEDDITGGEIQQSATSLKNATDLYLDILDKSEKQLTEAQAEAFINSLTDADKADPEFWNDVLENRTFETEEEYNNFVYSMTWIMKKLNEKASNTEFDTVKSNLKKALESNKPVFSMEDGQDKPSTAEKFSQGSYADHMKNNDWFYDPMGNSSVKDIYSDTIDTFLGKPNFATALEVTAGDIDKSIEICDITIASNTNDNNASATDLAILASSIVDYTIKKGSDIPSENSDTLYNLMNTIAGKLNKGTDSGTSDVMKKFLGMVGASIKNKNATAKFDVGYIGDTIYNNAQTNNFAQRNKVGRARDENDRHTEVEKAFEDGANGVTTFSELDSVPAASASTTANKPAPAPAPATESTPPADDSNETESREVISGS